jgi:predicted enzyme related to lactoylglutathione lyase
MEVLFARIGVVSFSEAVEWYARLFGRPADIVANDHEVMWRIADGGWLYVLEHADHPGSSQVTISVSDLAETVSDLADRGIASGPIEDVGTAGRKAIVTDPEGNTIALIHVGSPRRVPSSA